MKRFTVCDDFFEIFPDACFGVVLARNVDNTSGAKAEIIKLLRAAEDESEKFIRLDPLSKNPVVAVWREAFTKFKTKKGARASIEAMLKRVSKGERIGAISPVVDIYNSISLKHGVSVGAEDIDAFAGDLLLTLATGDEEFYLIGSDVNEPPYPGEIVYKDDAGCVCRNFNWRDGKRTMVTENSRNVFTIIEMVDKERLSELEAAIAELARLYGEHVGADTQTHILDRRNNSIEIG